MSASSQNPVAAPETEDDLYETRQLTDQITEMDGQLEATAAQLAAARQAVADREQLVKRLSAAIDERTARRITPRLQAFSDAVQRFATARARQGELELVLRQWDRADDIGASAEQLRADRERLRSEITSAQAALDERRREILAALNEEFRETVRALGIPASRQRQSTRPIICRSSTAGHSQTSAAAEASSLPSRSPTGPLCSPSRSGIATPHTPPC